VKAGSREKPYDLGVRTFEFAKQVISFVNKVQRTLSNIEIGKQLVRAAGSVGVNYIEANERLSSKDFVMRIKICRKEANEAAYWLKLVGCGAELESERSTLIQEGEELVRILAAITVKPNSSLQYANAKKESKP
jgi:four helix bundle protein